MEIILIDDDGKLKQKLINKRVNAKKEGIYFDLSYEDIVFLMKESGIKSSMWGFSNEYKFVLARYKDEGGYTKDNCRFIIQYENAKERKLTDTMRKSSSKNVKKASIKLKSMLEKDPDYLKGRHEKRKEQAKINRQKRYDASHPSFRGKKNSQYGTFWITNGIENKKWSREKGELPENFYRGRIT